MAIGHGLGFRAGQIGNGVARGSPPLPCFFGAVLHRHYAAQMSPATRYALSWLRGKCLIASTPLVKFVTFTPTEYKYTAMQLLFATKSVRSLIQNMFFFNYFKNFISILSENPLFDPFEKGFWVITKPIGSWTVQLSQIRKCK